MKRKEKKDEMIGMRKGKEKREGRKKRKARNKKKRRKKERRKIQRSTERPAALALAALEAQAGSTVPLLLRH